MKSLVFSGNKNITSGIMLFVIFFLLSFPCFSTSLCFYKESKFYKILESQQIVEIPLKNVNTKQNSYCCKDDDFLIWDFKKEKLHLVDEKGEIKSSAELSGGLVRLNCEYAFSVGKVYEEGKGFLFTLYEIKKSFIFGNIKLKKIAVSYADCFISDVKFDSNGVWIAGGSKDDSVNKLLYFSKNGLKFYCSIPKNNDFLRIASVSNEKAVLFLSGRDKSKSDSIVYFYDLNGKKLESKLLSDSNLFPNDFNCFFGYGFMFNDCVLIPASINDVLHFFKVDSNTMELLSVTNPCNGCYSPIGYMNGKFFYVARDPLIEDSYFGVETFDGENCTIGL